MKSGRIPEHFQVFMRPEEAAALKVVLEDVLAPGSKFDLTDDEEDIVRELAEALGEEP